MRYYQPRETDTPLAKAVWLALTIVGGAAFLMFAFLGLSIGSWGAVVIGLIIAVPALLLAGIDGWELAGGKKKKRRGGDPAEIKDPEVRRMAEQLIADMRADRATKTDGSGGAPIAVVTSRGGAASPKGPSSRDVQGARQDGNS